MNRPLVTMLALVASTVLPQHVVAQPAVLPIDGATSPVVAPSQVSDDRSVAVPDVLGSRFTKVAPVLVPLQYKGMKLTSIGSVGGLDGYLMQGAASFDTVLYVTPDGEHAVVGPMWDSLGRDVSQRQIGAMMTRFAEAAEKAGVSGIVKPDVPSSDPAPTESVVDRYRRMGFSVTPVGAGEGGVSAFIVTPPQKEGARKKNQWFYVAPDGRYAVSGILVRKDQMNVTGLQLAAYRQKLALARETAGHSGTPVVLDSVKKPAPQPAEFEVAPPEEETTRTVEVDRTPDTIVPSTQPSIPEASPTTVAPVAAPSSPEATAEPVGQPEDLLTTLSRPVSAPSPATGDTMAAYRSAGVDVNQLADALKATASFSVGDQKAPTLYMVADPQCPFCHEAWRRLKGKVRDREIQLRIIMIAGLNGSDEKAKSILSREDPGKAWLAGEGSVPGVPVREGPLPNSKEWNDASRYVEMNGMFAQRFDIRQTPFMIYVGKDQSVYFSLGLPGPRPQEDMDLFLSKL